MKVGRYWLPVLLWMGLIYWMSTDTFSAQNTALILEALLRFFGISMSNQQGGPWMLIIRKCAHLTEYFILGVLLFRAFRRDSSKLYLLKWAAFSVLAAAVYAAGDEFHQSFVASRTASVWDVLIDTAGGALAQAAVYLRLRKHDRGCRKVSPGP